MDEAGEEAVEAMRRTLSGRGGTGASEPRAGPAAKAGQKTMIDGVNEGVHAVSWLDVLTGGGR